MANYSSNTQPDSFDSENTLSRRVYAVLRDDIVAGRLKPGTRLVRKAVAARLGVSTIPIIEALYMLEIDGYVESRPLCGCRVRTLTLEEVDNNLILREALECQAARLAAEKITSETVDRLMKRAIQVDRFLRADTPDPSLGNQLHLEFHLELSNLSGHTIFGDILKRVWFQRYMSLNSIKAIRFHPIPEGWHQTFVKKLSQGNPDVAEQAMREHVLFGRQDDREALELYLKELRQDP
jgi:DNA-binding GntR family transcriptional regulator